MRILVTGGAGFVGSHLVRKVLGPQQPLGSEVGVTVLDSLAATGSLENLYAVRHHPEFRFVHGDVTDEAVVDQLMPDHQAVVHLAAAAYGTGSACAAGAFARTDVLGTQTLLDAALRHGTGVFVHVSTAEVYGPVPAGSVTETAPLRPGTPYAAAQASSDLLALSYHRTYGMDVRVTRCAENYGSHQFPEMLIPLFVTHLLQGRQLPLHGDGSRVRDRLHVDDHCRALLAVLVSGRPGEVYNVGGGAELCDRDVTAAVLAACGAGWDHVEWLVDRPGDARRNSVDWSKIRGELGYEPVHGFAEGLAETIAWYGRRHLVDPDFGRGLSWPE
ncbi:dTDP-glucose 4,6-dehydratase [Streptomyces sp. NPDC058622]|uniref:dTDP-glucose 4,6-dehydratase n=1 Tax=unclassified Streptomyces TaxID=2593676 RepID=UPI00364E2F8C